MDAVYILKNGYQNDELRHSLRSLKNLPHDNVHVVGYKPPWVKGVTYHPYDPGKPPLGERHKKHWKTWLMLRYLCVLDEISDDFILMNDDFYIMEPIDTIPTLHRGPISKILDSHRPNYRTNNIYLTAMAETQELLRSLGKPTLCYEVHAPMVIDRHKMTTAMEVVEAMSRPGQMHINKRSLYGNYWEIGGELCEDMKVDSKQSAFDKGSTFLSTSDHSFTSRSVGPFIKQSFPDRSPYEAGRHGNPYNSRTPRRGSGEDPGRRRAASR